jgi:hypothetical protein
MRRIEKNNGALSNWQMGSKRAAKFVTPESSTKLLSQRVDQSRFRHEDCRPLLATTTPQAIPFCTPLPAAHTPTHSPVHHELLDSAYEIRKRSARGILWTPLRQVPAGSSWRRLPRCDIVGESPHRVPCPLPHRDGNVRRDYGSCPITFAGFTRDIYHPLIA